MGMRLRKFGHLYSKVIMRNIGIFVFTGLLEVLFGPNGWLPHENMYAISLFVTAYILPAILAYGIAETASEQAGGITAVLAVTGLLQTDTHIGIAGALLVGTLVGLSWKRWIMPLKGKALLGMEFLSGNLAVAVCGLLLAVFNSFVTAPLLAGMMTAIGSGVDFLIRQKLLFLLGVLIEPAKVLFLNNSMNYGILIPLGMQQAQTAGNSVLFLLETNPGPGFGVLIAMAFGGTSRRREYGLGAFVEMVGGIHEVYFPAVLSNPWLLLPLIAGSTAGTVCFNLLGAGLVAPAAPGSILMILLVSGKYTLSAALIGVMVSAAVSAALTSVILRWKSVSAKQKTKAVKMGETEIGDACAAEVAMEAKIRQIGFVCDGGMGSSAMGASLLRRKLKERGLHQVTVTAHAIDMIPEGLDVLVCQKAYRTVLEQERGGKERIYAVDNLLETGGFETLITQIEALENGQRGAEV